MSHNIGYLTIPEHGDRQAALMEIIEEAMRYGDGYDSRITWHDDLQPLPSFAAAKDWITAQDKGWYDDHAVKFYDYSNAAKTAVIDKLEQQQKELVEKSRQYEKEHSVKRLKASYVGCPGCGSKLSRTHLHGEKCPLCYTDLRSATTITTIEKYRARAKELETKIENEKRKQIKSRTVKWLIKYEYHS